jgi:hypothetical protein
MFVMGARESNLRERVKLDQRTAYEGIMTWGLVHPTGVVTGTTPNLDAPQSLGTYPNKPMALPIPINFNFKPTKS